MRVGAKIFALVSTVVLAMATLSCWAFQDPLDTPVTKSALASRGLLNDVVRAGDRLVAVGQRGHILYSDDSGKRWIQSDVPVSSDLTAVHFPSPKKGWAVGHDGVVLASSDGGRTWAKQLDGRSIGKIMVDYYAKQPPADLSADGLAQLQSVAKRLVDEGADKPFLAVWFESETTGYVVGLFNLIFRTTDGGQSWIPWFDRTDNPQLLHFYAIRPVGKDLYLAGEQGLVLKLDKPALRFRAVSVDYKGSLFGITGVEQTVLVFGLRGSLFRSSDSGAHWHKLETGIKVAITGATVTNDGHVVLVSQAGHLLRSTDGGETFANALVANPSPASAIALAGEHEFVTVGARGANQQALKQ